VLVQSALIESAYAVDVIPGALKWDSDGDINTLNSCAQLWEIEDLFCVFQILMIVETSI